jgi:hypothetical protein
MKISELFRIFQKKGRIQRRSEGTTMLDWIVSFKIK